jgi:cytochrome c2
VNWIGVAVAALAIGAAGAGAAWVGVRDHRATVAAARALTGGEPDLGRTKIVSIGCAACHTIPGIKQANATVGPPLTKFAYRSYVAGVARNSPDNLVRWLMDPPSVLPSTAMPNLGLTNEDARDIAAYLYTLK